MTRGEGRLRDAMKRFLFVAVLTASTTGMKCSRRHAMAHATALVAATCTQPAFAKPLKAYTEKERDTLDMASRSAEGKMLPSGIRVIGMTEDEDAPPAAAVGDRVYVHFKVWTKGFRSSPPVDSSFEQQRPYDFILGEPDDRIFPGIDQGVRGMREGSWRRLVVPPELAYGEGGLQKSSRGAYLVPPNEAVFVDVLMYPTKACDAVLRPPGKKGLRRAFGHDGTTKTTNCK